MDGREEKGPKHAQVTMGIPSEQFEAAQQRMRALAVQVLVDTASGQDVSEGYVDLQSRANNLEATAMRIRGGWQHVGEYAAGVRRPGDLARYYGCAVRRAGGADQHGCMAMEAQAEENVIRDG